MGCPFTLLPAVMQEKIFHYSHTWHSILGHHRPQNNKASQSQTETSETLSPKKSCSQRLSQVFYDRTWNLMQLPISESWCGSRRMLASEPTWVGHHKDSPNLPFLNVKEQTEYYSIFSQIRYTEERKRNSPLGDFEMSLKSVKLIKVSPGFFKVSSDVWKMSAWITNPSCGGC